MWSRLVFLSVNPPSQLSQRNILPMLTQLPVWEPKWIVIKEEGQFSHDSVGMISSGGTSVKLYQRIVYGTGVDTISIGKLYSGMALTTTWYNSMIV